MAFELDISAASRGLLRVADFPDLAREPIRRVLKEEAAEVRADTAASIGRQGGPGRRSLPGQPPARDSGNLLRSLQARLARSRKADERAYVLTSWPLGAHGHLLESGTRRMRPRPFLVPARSRRGGGFASRIQSALDEAAQKTNAT